MVCKTATLRAEQSSLTGEPQAVLKGVDPVADPNCELQVRSEQLYLWCWVVLGEGTSLPCG